jgi:hypothetical protein
MSIISRGAEIFKVEISLREFFESPTVAHMAEMISEQESMDGDDAGLSDTLEAVESLSDEQAVRLLEKETK